MASNKSLGRAALVLLAGKGAMTAMRLFKERRERRAQREVSDEARSSEASDGVMEASMESFPASDPPSFSPGTT